MTGKESEREFSHSFLITGNPAIKKNNRPIFVRTSRSGAHKPFIGKSHRLRDAEQSALYELISQRNKSNVHMLSMPLHVSFLFYRQDGRRVDLINLLEFPADMLQSSGIIENDLLIKSVDGSRVYIDRENPRTEITITPF